jgi:hypothetical protein
VIAVGNTGVSIYLDVMLSAPKGKVGYSGQGERSQQHWIIMAPVHV